MGFLVLGREAAGSKKCVQVELSINIAMIEAAAAPFRGKHVRILFNGKPGSRWLSLLALGAAKEHARDLPRAPACLARGLDQDVVCASSLPPRKPISDDEIILISHSRACRGDKERQEEQQEDRLCRNKPGNHCRIVP
jgi:hypothetical protein